MIKILLSLIFSNQSLQQIVCLNLLIIRLSPIQFPINQLIILMGGTPTSITVTQSDFQHTTSYEIDIRLLNMVSSVPTYFNISSLKVIQEIQQLINKIPQHPLEKYLIYALDKRFYRFNTINMQALQAGKSTADILSIDDSKFEHKEWVELQSKQNFLKLLASLQKQYWVQLRIKQEFQIVEGKKNNGGFQTLRKPIEGVQQSSLNDELVRRLLYHYYLTIIKQYANSGDRHVSKFHEETGRQLCLLILHGHLSLEELYQLFYRMVYIQKHPGELVSRLAVINHRYHYQCLKTCYTIALDKKKLDRLQAAARLYLDQLYLNSLREAEDPEIKVSDDTLLPIKMFPISRVKDKPRT